MTPSAASPHGPAPPGRQGRPALLIRLMINLAVPVLAYVLLRPHVHSDITALVIGAAVPTAYSAGVLLWRRRLDAIGVFAIVCFVIGLVLVVATGGNELVFKLREDIWTGTLGLACLISVAVGRPLFFVALQLAARRNTQIAERISDPQAGRITTVTTGVIGVILFVHALVIVALALTASTTTFLALKPPLSLAIVGGGVAALVFWIRRQYTGRRHRSPRHEAAGPAGPARQHGQGSPAETHDPSDYTRPDSRAGDAGLNAGCAPIRPDAPPLRLHGGLRGHPLFPMEVRRTRTAKERRVTMPTVTIPRTDITSEQIGAALRDGLDDRYDVLPGMRMTRIPIGSPRAADPDEIVVGKGPSPMVRAQVTILRRADHTDIRITPGGVAGDLLMNTLGIARKIRRVLLDAPGIGS